MSGITQTSPSSFSAVTAYANNSAPIKTDDASANAAKINAAKAIERNADVNLNRAGLINLPRDVVFAKDIQTTRVKATRQADQIQSSSKTDPDNDRILGKAQRYKTASYIDQDTRNGQQLNLTA
jgi:hypothetical protein